MTVPEALIIESSPRPQLTDIVLNISPPHQSIPEVQLESSSFTTPKADKGKGIARDTNDSPLKLFKATREVRLDPDAPTLIIYEINEEMYQLTNEEIHAQLEKQEQMEKASPEARITELSKLELIEGGKAFLKKHDTEFKALQKEHLENHRKSSELKKKRNNDLRNFDVHKNLKFSDFGVSECDELSVIIPKKKNKALSKLMTSLSNKYVRLKEILGELGINPSIPLPEQDLSLPSNRKRKAIELEPEVHMAGLECNHALPEGIQFVNNMVIEKPEHVIFFIDTFGDQAF
ncbi:hypothetical protein Tco_1253994 [Tanacetum coccineum]